MQHKDIEELSVLLHRLADLFEEYASICDEQASQILMEITKA